MWDVLLLDLCHNLDGDVLLAVAGQQNDSVHGLFDADPEVVAEEEPHPDALPHGVLYDLLGALPADPDDELPHGVIEGLPQLPGRHLLVDMAVECLLPRLDIADFDFPGPLDSKCRVREEAQLVQFDVLLDDVGLVLAADADLVQRLLVVVGEDRVLERAHALLADGPQAPLAQVLTVEQGVGGHADVAGLGGAPLCRQAEWREEAVFLHYIRNFTRVRV